MLTVPPLDPRERARLDEQARNLAFIVTRGSHLSVRRERSARGEYLTRARPGAPGRIPCGTQPHPLDRPAAHTARQNPHDRRTMAARALERAPLRHRKRRMRPAGLREPNDAPIPGCGRYPRQDEAHAVGRRADGRGDTGPLIAFHDPGKPASRAVREPLPCIIGMHFLPFRSAWNPPTPRRTDRKRSCLRRAWRRWSRSIPRSDTSGSQ